MKRKKIHPLAKYSSLPMPKDQLTFSSREKEDKFLNDFFQLRETQSSRFEELAKKLLDEGSLNSHVSGIEINYKLVAGKLTYVFSPEPSNVIACELGHEPLPWRKRNKIIALVDRLVESEILALQGYQPHGY